MKKIQSELNLSKARSNCRVCLSADLQEVLSLGSTPPANAFLKKENLGKAEPFFPLTLDFCKKCGFIQLQNIVSPELLFRDYVYVSSTSPVFVAHFEELAETIKNRFDFPANSLIVDIGSNDGILLQPFKARGWKILGIDPAVKIAEMATENGIETWPEFFNPKIAKKIIAEKGKAKIVSATSVFPHIDDLDNIVAGVKELLAEDGFFLVEAYYLADLVEKNLFDTIYHEHLSYFTVKTMSELFKRLGMEIFNVEKTNSHGGSLRVFAQRNRGARRINAVAQKFIAEETKRGFDRALTYLNFSNKIEENKNRLLRLLNDLKKRSKKIIGYGAPAKGNTLLNYFQIGPETLDYIVDDSSWKQGLYTPGMHIPVVSSAELSKNKPDYILILAWNFAEPIMKKLSQFAKEGGKFIVPIPNPTIKP
ncbi:MAG: hypothetical protein A3A16_02815 [Candidatus Harrisonbacteria bacterium RIFCSPLOWO2_01_FULL_44_18]|uniref:Methyltransferase n=1 Tax=Candidatus Harrisonbacteria bacterium RIFCSPLOWO2_01_FULL_44_18 TaxID=1798407 RepID=A0A1G1ZLG0_9BACT|nr:MAG: hypothetical protein A3A16_02815 [Candidatus Harrisonbacteria bacterium RIFCSPLOWO2_01_FULL_44_18]